MNQDCQTVLLLCMQIFHTAKQEHYMLEKQVMLSSWKVIWFYFLYKHNNEIFCKLSPCPHALKNVQYQYDFSPKYVFGKYFDEIFSDSVSMFTFSNIIYVFAFSENHNYKLIDIYIYTCYMPYIF